METPLFLALFLGWIMIENKYSNLLKLKKSKAKPAPRNSANHLDKKASFFTKKQAVSVDENLHPSPNFDPRDESRQKRDVLDSLTSRFGTDQYRVEGGNRSALINGLMSVTTVKNLHYDEGSLGFFAPRKHRAEIIALINTLCYNHTIVGTRSIPASLISVLKRTGLVVGLFCAVCVFCLYNSFVWSVQTEGVGDGAMDVLSRHGVRVGGRSIDIDAVERDLLSLDGVAFASVEKRGTRVYVRVVSELAPDAYVDVGAGPVTASFDAVVTRVIVFSGTAEVKVGDVVQKGQTLIGEYHLKGEDKIPAVASGQVYGERVVTVERFFPDQYMGYSGEQQTISRISVFGNAKPPKPPYEHYAVKVSHSKNNFIIPYELTSWTFFEVTLLANNLDDKGMIDRAYGEVIANNNFEKVISTHSSVERVEGGHLVTIQLTVEEKL